MEEPRCNGENHPTQELYHEDEVIDTLSLSDLLIYDNNGNPQEFYQVDDQNRNHDIDDQFEFSSELLKTSVLSNNVVFCGKIIPYKETSPFVSQNTHKLESKKQQTRHKQRWRSFVRFFKKSSRLSSAKANLDSEKLDLKYQVPIRKVSILASATKSRWYLLMFGFGSSRFPGEMHIRDLKKRQSSMETKGCGDNKINCGNGGGIGAWSLVRFLGCGGGGGSRGSDHLHPNTIVKIE